jgi:hypothetical protein
VIFVAGLETAVLSGAAYIIAGSSSGLVTLLAALSPIIAAAVGAYLAWRLRQVHTLVNSRMTAALDRITLLERKLGLAAGEALPPTPCEGTA